MILFVEFIFLAVIMGLLVFYAYRVPFRYLKKYGMTVTPKFERAMKKRGIIYGIITSIVVFVITIVAVCIGIMISGAP